MADSTLPTPSAGPDPATRTLPPDGPVIAGRYHVVRPLGEGGMGSVFLARDAELDRDVAIKVLPGDRVTSTDTVKRFRREAQALARLSHPGIVQAFDVGEHDGKPFLVMEYVAGVNLADRLKASGPLPPTRAADVGHQVALALAYAHSQGLVHRDVKPGNLILTPEGRVKLLDLGLARFLQDHVGDGTRTREGAGMGTPDYSAPEQFRDARTADARADVYALGCTLYHLTGGRVPFPGSSLSEKLSAHEALEATPLEELNPDVPLGLALAVRKMMGKRPAERFQTAREAADALAPYVAGGATTIDDFRQTAAWDGSQIRTGGRRRSRGWQLVAGLIAGLLVAVLGLTAAERAGWVRFGGAPEVAQGPSAPVKPPDVAPQPAPVPVAVPDDPDVLTVSQKPEDGGKYRTIADALAAVKPGQTVRVLDASEYAEHVWLLVRNRHEGVTVEAPRGAVLRQPQSPALVYVKDVPGVTVRGFRLPLGGKNTHGAVVRGASPGSALEDLDVTAQPDGASRVGVSLEALDCPFPRAVVVRGCRATSLRVGMRVSGSDDSGRKGVPCRGARLVGNVVENCLGGIVVSGDADDCQIVGNRTYRGTACGIQVTALIGRPRRLLIANNTVAESNLSFAVFGRPDEWGERTGVAFRNNLIVGPNGLDLTFTDTGDDPDGDGGPGDGTALARGFTLTHNWREVEPQEKWAALGWIPQGKADVVRAKIAGIDRDPKSPAFLRPAKDSPLATQGAGSEDPTLPRYVGALPPAGEYPWDWDRTFRMPPDAQLLTVSQDENDGGTYRTIAGALKDAKPWATVRVLDDAVYPEAVALGLERHTGVTLEAVRRATLATPDHRFMVFIRSVPWVTVRGFRLRGEVRGQILAGVTGASHGVLLDDVEAVAGKGQPDLGIALEHVDLPADAPPVVIRGCRVVRAHVGIQVAGLDADYRTRRTTARVVVRDNRIESPMGGINLLGDVRDVQVVGNAVTGARNGGIQLENLLDTTRDVLIANNTISESEDPIRLWDNKAKGVLGTRVRVRNNLLLGVLGAEVIYKDAINPLLPRGPGDGSAVAARWRFDHNWRESAAPPGADGHVPPGPTDVRRPKFDGIERDAKSPMFLRPAKDSPLATQGAGTEDPTLPRYVGALPPEGTEAWDWDRTWRWTARPRADDTPKPPEKTP